MALIGSDKSELILVTNCLVILMPTPMAGAEAALRPDTGRSVWGGDGAAGPCVFGRAAPVCRGLGQSIGGKGMLREDSVPCREVMSSVNTGVVVCSVVKIRSGVSMTT